MKISMLIILVFFLITSRTSLSQSIQSISLGPDLGIPSKSLGNSSVSLGGSIEYQLKFNAPVGMQVHAGYNYFKDQFGGKVSFLPVRAGVVGYVYQDLIFVNADAGVSHYYSPTTGTKQNGFSFSAGAGYKLPLNDKQFIQLSAYYNLHNFRNDMFGQNYNYNWFNIRAAYGFSFGKNKKPKEK